MNEPVVKLESVAMGHDGIAILRNVTFELGTGEFAYLIGKTGAGKSTLMKILYGDLTPIEGTAMVAGVDLGGLSVKNIPELRRQLGIVFQDFQLLMDRSVLANLEFVLKVTGWAKGEMRERAEAVLKLVGLSEKGYAMPHQLSGGEQQRVVIARALLNQPKIILADEPTGNLDPDTSKEIMQLLVNISKTGTAVLMATHDYYLIDKFPARLLRCEDHTVTDLGALMMVGRA